MYLTAPFCLCSPSLAGLKPDSAEIAYIPINTVPVAGLATARTLVKLHDALEESEDVSAVFSNEELSDELSAAVYAG